MMNRPPAVQPTSLTISRAVTGEDFRAAVTMLAEYRHWLCDAMDVDLAAAQPSAGSEFEDLRLLLHAA